MDNFQIWFYNNIYRPLKYRQDCIVWGCKLSCAYIAVKYSEIKLQYYNYRQKRVETRLLKYIEETTILSPEKKKERIQELNETFRSEGRKQMLREMVQEHGCSINISKIIKDF